MEAEGFDPKKGFMFGFSLGARVVIEAGRNFGEKKIPEIDVCDPAGPGFDDYKFDPRLSAENVQCIHTSSDKGTKRKSDCNQNWLMGNCGESQDGRGDYPKGLFPFFI